ncbi:MAG: glycosyltransferase [Candidatus Diapherotrites archaeon]|nr:glycosyltransferase [Candidatus Diapherotrites archaeon]
MRASVIIPVYNGARTISNTLSALQRQDLKRTDFEVLVVDDGSTDETARIVSGFRDILVLSQPNAGPAVARNNGAKKAKGEIVVFLDSDCVPRNDWLTQMLAPFEDPAVMGCQGRYENPLPQWMARFVQLEIEERYARMATQPRIDFVGSYSAAYRREVFLAQGGFDTGFRAASGEDPDLSFRLADKGYRLVFNSDAVVAHFHPTSLAKYWKTKFFRAYWRVRMYAKNPGKLQGDSYTNPLLKYQIILAAAAIGSTALFLIGTLVPLSIGNWYPAAFGYSAATYLLAGFLLTIPTAAFMARRDPVVGVLAPFVLLVNMFLFLAGLVYGYLRGVQSG